MLFLSVVHVWDFGNLFTDRTGMSSRHSEVEVQYMVHQEWAVTGITLRCEQFLFLLSNESIYFVL